MSGLPPHIAQVICGHRNNRHHDRIQAVTPPRRSRRTGRSIARPAAHPGPARIPHPHDEEWDAFLAHFEKRRYPWHLRPRVRHPLRHEQPCVRCSLLRPDPTPRPAGRDRANLPTASPRPEREGWLARSKGLKVSLAGTAGSARPDRAALRRQGEAVQLDMPAFPGIAGRSVTTPATRKEPVTTLSPPGFMLPCAPAPAASIPSKQAPAS